MTSDILLNQFDKNVTPLNPSSGALQGLCIVDEHNVQDNDATCNLDQNLGNDPSGCDGNLMNPSGFDTPVLSSGRYIKRARQEGRDIDVQRRRYVARAAAEKGMEMRRRRIYEGNSASISNSVHVPKMADNVVVCSSVDSAVLDGNVSGAATLSESMSGIVVSDEGTWGHNSNTIVTSASSTSDSGISHGVDIDDCLPSPPDDMLHCNQVVASTDLLDPVSEHSVEYSQFGIYDTNRVSSLGDGDVNNENSVGCAPSFSQEVAPQQAVQSDVGVGCGTNGSSYSTDEFDDLGIDFRADIHSHGGMYLLDLELDARRTASSSFEHFIRAASFSKHTVAVISLITEIGKQYMNYGLHEFTKVGMCDLCQLKRGNNIVCKYYAPLLMDSITDFYVLQLSSIDCRDTTNLVELFRCGAASLMRSEGLVAGSADRSGKGCYDISPGIVARLIGCFKSSTSLLGRKAIFSHMFWYGCKSQLCNEYIDGSTPCDLFSSMLSLSHFFLFNLTGSMLYSLHMSTGMTGINRSLIYNFSIMRHCLELSRFSSSVESIDMETLRVLIMYTSAVMPLYSICSSVYDMLNTTVNALKRYDINATSSNGTSLFYTMVYAYGVLYNMEFLLKSHPFLHTSNNDISMKLCSIAISRLRESLLSVAVYAHKYEIFKSVSPWSKITDYRFGDVFDEIMGIVFDGGNSMAKELFCIKFKEVLVDCKFREAISRYMSVYERKSLSRKRSKLKGGDVARLYGVNYYLASSLGIMVYITRAENGGRQFDGDRMLDFLMRCGGGSIPSIGYMYSLGYIGADPSVSLSNTDSNFYLGGGDSNFYDSFYIDDNGYNILTMAINYSNASSTAVNASSTAVKLLNFNMLLYKHLDNLIMLNSMRYWEYCSVYLDEYNKLLSHRVHWHVSNTCRIFHDVGGPNDVDGPSTKFLLWGDELMYCLVPGSYSGMSDFSRHVVGILSEQARQLYKINYLVDHGISTSEYGANVRSRILDRDSGVTLIEAALMMSAVLGPCNNESLMWWSNNADIVHSVKRMLCMLAHFRSFCSVGTHQDSVGTHQELVVNNVLVKDMSIFNSLVGENNLRQRNKHEYGSVLDDWKRREVAAASVRL